MQFGGIIILVNDPDAALKTYVKMFGTNNIEQIIKLKGLNDGVDVVDGFYLRTSPIHLGLFKPRSTGGRLGTALAKHGEGIHHIEIHMPQDAFEETYVRFKHQGRSVSDKLTYIGKFSEALFWLEEGGSQGLPIKFCTKAMRSLGLWRDTVYLDTPQKFEPITLEEEIIRPVIAIKSIMVTVSDFETLPVVWSEILSRPWVEAGDIYLRTHGKVDDKRGNIFIPIR
jgi:catechol 2,3-dioxygenase-like lactoylglutathione lyase family enzyme